MTIPKVKPYVAIRALFTRIIPTDVTTLNIHDARSSAIFLSPLVVESISKPNFLICIAEEKNVVRSTTNSNEIVQHTT